MSGPGTTQNQTMERPAILLVDDEVRILQGLQRQLHRDWTVTIAPSPEEALVKLETAGPFAVIVSDMRMPNMDGAALLSRARALAPDTVRILLTGQAELSAAIAAVNEGRIFRFLCKPCPVPTLMGALSEAREQYRLIHAERELLEKTLRGAVDALVETLSLTQPMAFGRAMRLKMLARELCQKVQRAAPWDLEVAALLSQLGAVVLPATVVERLQRGAPLDEEERKMVERMPAVVDALIGHLPRLETVREILRRRRDAFSESVPFGARVLAVVEDFDLAEAQCGSGFEAVLRLRARDGRYDPALLEALAQTALSSRDEGPMVREVRVDELRVGMVLAADVYAKSGLLLVSRSNEVTISLMERLHNFQRIGIREPLVVRVPRAAARAA
jgi:response regulator RpfG family c-di-GMP phosphodiesterase